MSTIRFPGDLHENIYNHLFTKDGEHFAFMLANWTYSAGKPVFLVRESFLIPDERVTINEHGWEVDLETIVEVINRANKTGYALIEAHNHRESFPRFSVTDRRGLTEFSKYILSSLPDRPYGATVWGNNTIYGEYFLENGSHEAIRSITVLGSRLIQIVSQSDDNRVDLRNLKRQLPWFTEEIQRQLGRIRIGIVGNGGTGCQIIVALTCLGCRDFVLIDDDIAEDHSMNRLVTATASDIGELKVVLGERWIRNFAPDANVQIIRSKLQTIKSIDALKGVDVLFGCGDNDGMRLILNEIALAYNLPLLDLGIEIEAEDGVVSSAVGRVAVILPEGPCLNCMEQIDWREARFVLGSPEERQFQLDRGYVAGMNVTAPAVGPLNGVVANVAALEFAVLVSGQRVLSPFSEYDFLGTGREKNSQWLAPRRIQPVQGCIQCSLKGIGDKASILERYAETQMV